MNKPMEFLIERSDHYPVIVKSKYFTADRGYDALTVGKIMMLNINKSLVLSKIKAITRIE